MATTVNFNRKYMVRWFILYTVAGLFAITSVAVLSQFAPVIRVAFAADVETSVIEGVLRVMKIIGILAGGILALVGLIKFIIAQSNENGQEQQKAIMMMVSGAALIIVSGLVAELIPWSEILDDAKAGVTIN